MDILGSEMDLVGSINGDASGEASNEGNDYFKEEVRMDT
jgi:hypothetical protein